MQCGILKGESEWEEVRLWGEGFFLMTVRLRKASGVLGRPGLSRELMTGKSHPTKMRRWLATCGSLQQVWKWNESVGHSVVSLCNPMDYSLPDSSIHGILQARVLEWVAFPFSRGSSWLRDWTQGSNPGVLHCRQILYHLSHQGSPAAAINFGSLQTRKKTPEWLESDRRGGDGSRWRKILRSAL